jgi:hypothetical protein
MSDAETVRAGVPLTQPGSQHGERGAAVRHVRTIAQGLLDERVSAAAPHDEPRRCPDAFDLAP